MAANKTVVNRTFGVTSGAPAGMTLRVTFTESAVNAAKGTSTVKALVQIVNGSANNERWYRYKDGFIHIRVGNTVRYLPTWFDVGAGKTITKGTLTWTGVNHASGSVSVNASISLPSGGATSGPYSGNPTLTLNNAPAAPTAPKWASSNVVGPTGVGTQTYLNWTNRINVSPVGNAQVSPYTGLYLHISQANYPSHFNPTTLASDISLVNNASSYLANSNYAIQTFWYTAQGKTLPSQVVYKANVPTGQVIRVKPPANPPKTAQYWGIAVSRTPLGPANAANVTVQSLGGLQRIPLTKSWTSPTSGPTKNGPPPPSSSFANNFAWSQNTVVNIQPVNGVFPSTINVATTGGYWYQFSLVARNKAGSASTAPRVYYAPGTAPSSGGGTSGDAGEGGANLAVAPAANIPVVANALNRLNASLGVVPTVSQVIDFAAQGTSLTEASAAVTVANYCGDPRAYWLTANSSGNNTASPFVAEVGLAGYASHNAQVLPTQMTYALLGLGIGELDRGHTQSFLAANNNTGSTVSAAVTLGSSPDTPVAANSFPVPAGSTTVQVSAYAFVNSANAAAGRTVTPYSQVKITAMAANGVVLGMGVANQNPVPPNVLTRLTASYSLPANTASVVAGFNSDTAAGANWVGGFQAGDTVTTTGFMLTFNEQPTMPYFDGGWPYPATTIPFALHTSADLAYSSLGNITQTRNGQIAGLP